MWKEDKKLIIKIIEIINNRHEKELRCASDELFYHYTNANGLLGVFESRSIWSTHFRYLNDITEFDYGLEIIFEVLDVYLKEQNFDDAKVGKINYVFRDQLSLDINKADVYVACFCTNGDLLSQWRGYAGSEGYSIGFTDKTFTNENHLSNVNKNTNIEWNFGKVSYGNDAKEYVKEIIPYCVKIVESFLVEYPSGSTRNGNIEFVPYFDCMKLLFFHIPFFSKHEGFGEEMEWNGV